MINSNGTFVPEIVDNEETPTVTESQGHIVDAPYSSNLQHSSSNHDQVGAFSVTISHPVDNDLSFPASGQGQMGIAINFTHELIPRSYSLTSNYQSLPLFEATLVYDVPEEPIYDAVRIDPTQDNDSHGWSRRVKKYKAIIFVWLVLALVAIVALVAWFTTNSQMKKVEKNT
jgi:hypothetical protein